MKRRSIVSTVLILLIVLFGCSQIIKAGATENLAHNKAYFESTSYSDKYDVEKVFDGDEATRWSAATGSAVDQFVGVDFGVGLTYNKVVIKEMNYTRISSYVLQYSNDGESYVDIVGTAGETVGEYKSIEFEPINSRYFRLFIYESRNSDGLKEPTINEVEVYFIQ